MSAVRIQYLRHGAALIPFPRRCRYTGTVKAQTALSPLKGKKPAEDINFPCFRCLPCTLLTPCACFPGGAGTKAGSCHQIALQGLLAMGNLPGLVPGGRGHWGGFVCRQALTAWKARLNCCPSAISAQPSFVPRTKPACTVQLLPCAHRPLSPAQGSGLKLPLVSHPQMLALTLHLGVLRLDHSAPHSGSQGVRLGFSSAVTSAGVRGWGNRVERCWDKGSSRGQVSGTAVIGHE